MEHIHFLHLVKRKSDQNTYLLKHITKPQLNLLSKIAIKVLKGQIQLSKSDFRNLETDKNFIRKLSTKKQSTSLNNHLKTIQILANLGIKNETYAKTSISSNTGMGKTQRQEISKSNSDSDSSSIGSITSEESESESGESGESDKSRNEFKSREGGEERNEHIDTKSEYGNSKQSEEGKNEEKESSQINN